MMQTGSKPQEHGLAKEMDGDDVSFIRTEDVICLVCTSGDSMKRGYLAAEGFGSQLCHLEPEPRNQEPCELWKCTFQLEDALSVHAMYTHGLKAGEKRQSSRKILMYGHAVLLRHVETKKLLRCLSTSPSTDKLAYNIGFTERPFKSSMNESCWFTVHPASNQRSEGEKVRAGDDIFLVNVANERYLSAQLSFFQNAESDSISKYKQPLNMVQASFHQCVWALHIVCSGSAKEAAIGNVNGGDVVRFIHRHGSEDCLAVAARDSNKDVTADKAPAEVCYEPAQSSLLHSVWRVELFKMRFGGGFTSWGQPFRLRHVVTGKFLGVKVEGCSEGVKGKEREEKHCVVLLDSGQASKEASAFCFTTSSLKESHQWSELRADSMGLPEVHFGDSEVFLLHCKSERVVGCAISERGRQVRSLRGLRRAVAQAEMHQSFAFTVTRASEEQAKAASIIQLCEDTMRHYVQKMLLQGEQVSGSHLSDKLYSVLSDLSYYFNMPERRGLQHDQFQQQLCELTERQHLFRKQGMLQFTLSVIIETGKKCKVCDPTTERIHHKLYELLAAMIRGNHLNCREFATRRWLEVFINQLDMSTFTHDVLEVIQCLLTDSPEVLNIISEEHIEVIVNILNTNGRDEKVMKLLSSLCVCHGVAMRDKQRLISKHLLSCRDLLLQTSLHNRVHCVHPSVYLGVCEGSAMHRKWYFEVELTQMTCRSSCPPHFRVGWAHASLFQPRPTSNSFSTTSGGIGDDVYSLAFDGESFWVGGHSTRARRLHRQSNVGLTRSDSATPISVGDVIGCCLDLEREVAWFTKNGSEIPGHLVFHHCRKMVTPAISFSAGISVIVLLGGHLGRFHHSPPLGYAGIHETVQEGSEVRLQPFLCLGDSSDLLVAGPAIHGDYETFVPAPIDTSNVMLPDPVMSIRDKLAKNIHEVWSKNKIEMGYSYAEVRNDDQKHNPCLKAFEDLTEGDRRYDYDMALETLRTLVALGYQVSSQNEGQTPVAYLDLPEKYRQSNGYLPRPLDLGGVALNPSLQKLVERLAENAHNIWASGRIKEGWSYGRATDSQMKRSPLLLPYCKLDTSVRKTNWDTAFESVRTISALGCTVEPPSAPSSSIHQLGRTFSDSNVQTRTFRGQTCYRLTKGKWYYEVKLLTEGMMRVGWATPSFPAGQQLGADEHSYAYDGFLARKWHNGSEGFGRRWNVDDIVGCLLDMAEKTISFTLNGELLRGSFDSTIAFENVDTSNGLMPAITLSAAQRAQLNFGKSEEALHSNYTALGFEPVCSPAALHYNIPLWYSSPHGAFEIIGEQHSHLTTSRRANAKKKMSIISVSCRDWDYSHRPTQECLRLNFGVTLPPQDLSPSNPSLHPRPGPLSPSPTSEQDILQIFSKVCFTPKKLMVSYSIVVPAGQDPSLVFIGWTTSGFQYIQSQFHSGTHLGSDPSLSPLKYGQQVDMVNQRRLSTTSFSTAFLVCLSELLTNPPQHIPTAVTVHCIVDTTAGQMIFRTDGSSPTKKISLVASGGCKLFPTVIITPSTEHFISFDFTPDTGCQSIYSVLTSARANSKLGPCLPRMKIMAFVLSQWMRQPVHKATFSTHSVTGGSLQLTAEKDPVYSIYATLPEEDTVINIQELSENHKLLGFHIQTLEAYSAVCSHSNQQLAEAISALLDTDQLLQCLRVEGMRFELRAAYLKLLSSLHLEHEVLTRLMMRGEFILPRSECTRSISLFPVHIKKPQKMIYSISKAPFPGLDPALSNQASISHNITSSFSRMPYKADRFPIDELKELVFTDLEHLLATQYFSGRLLPCQGSSDIFVPLLKILDQLLVMGVIQEDKDLRRLLELLDPEQFIPSGTKKRFHRGLLSLKVAVEEPMKLELCNLLQHLCDCQVQHRIEATVAFTLGFVDQLQEQQKLRHAKDFKKRPKEFRSSPEKQVEYMLSFKRTPVSSESHKGKKPSSKNPPQHPDCHTSEKLQKMLQEFHAELKYHCGCVDSGTLISRKLEDMGIREKLEQLVELVMMAREEKEELRRGEGVTTLQQLITTTMLRWASLEVDSPELVAQIFALLYRQYDEIHEVVQALRKTYVIEVEENGEGKPNYDIPCFRQALGYLRLHLKVGMGKAEEKLLKESLRSIRNSDLFYCHPHLLRSMGVHSTVLGLMKTYLGISSGSVDDQVLSARRKQRLAMLKEGLPAPVEACCKFLCKFARISHANQMDLFEHIGYLLEHSEKYPGLMTCQGYTPLDVATATIKDNQELVLALEPSHLEYVVSLLVATTTAPYNETHDQDSALTTVRTSSVSCEWAPNGGEKCLEFLQSAVWVDNEQIQENAYLVVRLLIRHSECLGPALAGEALGLRWIYEDAIDHLEDTPQFFTPRDSSADLPLQSQDSADTSGLHHSRSSYFNLTLLSTRLLLSFYTNLVRLLACCGPGSASSQGCSTTQTLRASQQKKSTVERTRSILQNLIKVDEIVGILSLPFSRDTRNGMCPQHKEAGLLFLDRVYGVTGPELLLRLLVDAFLPDIKNCLKLVQDGSESQQYSSLSRYICCSVLPLLCRFASVFRQLLSHLHVIDNLLMCCFRLAYTAQLSVPQLEETATFLITIIRELHPRVIQRFMPKIVADIPNLNTHSHSIVTLKLLSSHYEYFARYYGSGMLERTCLGLASEEEKTCSALVVYRLLDALSEKLPSSLSLLRSSTSCLRAVSSALGPDCLVPSRLLMASMYNCSNSTYEPRPVDTSRVLLSPELTDFVTSFASFQHDCWSHDKQSEGWTYGPNESEEKHQHPYLRPFNSLPEEYCRLHTRPAEDAVKYLLVRGWSLSKVRPMDTRSVPLKKKMTCIRRRRRRAGSFIRKEEREAANYEPSVMDLSKAETPVELLAIAEQMAENAHDKWAKELNLDNADFLSHQLYQPYELLDEVVKDNDRTYALDILRYLRVSGFELNRTRVRMSTMVQASQGSQCQEKFAIQLFGKALELLEAKLEMQFYLGVLFPMLTSYLDCHAGYFMPLAVQRSNSFASLEEKGKILQMFCRVMEFTRHNLDKLFASARKLTAQTVLSPVDGKGKEAEGDTSVIAARGILALVESLIRALDMKGILRGSASEVHADIVDFFRQATSGIHLTTKGIGRQTEADVQFHFYCLHFLIPSLTALFRHLGVNNAGRDIIAGPVLNHCRYIFQNLVDMAMGCGPVFVGSPPLIAIGKCMGAFSLAYPEPFLEHGLFGKGFNMQLLLRQLGTATMQGVTGGNVLFVVDVIIPVLANYIARWWSDTNNGDPTPVSVVQVDEVLTQVLSLMAAHFGHHRVKWFLRVIESSLLLAGKCSLDLLQSQFVPLLEELRERAISIWQDEHYLYATKSSEWSDTQTQKVEALNEDYCIFVRDLMMVLPFLSVFLHANREALRNPEEGVEKAVRSLFVSVTDIFHCWFSSQHFRREFQSATQCHFQQPKFLILNNVLCSWSLNSKTRGKGAEGKRSPNLLLVCLQLLLPINDQWLSKGDRELVDRCRERLGEKGVTPDDLKVELMEHLQSQLVSRGPLARKLVHHLSKPFFSPGQTLEERVLQILNLARVKHRMYQVENPVTTQSRWRQLFTQRKRKAVINCFLAVPYFQLSKHRAVNLFLQTYCSHWLMNAEYSNHEMLTEELLDHQDHLRLLEQERRERGGGEGNQNRCAGVPRHDPLSQLFTMFKRLASTQSCTNEGLYMSYADVLSKSVIGHSEEDEMTADDNPTKAYELYSKRKAELIVKQAQLAERGAPTMVLLVITASKGEMSPVVHSTLRLGVALLKEGNQKIQHDMLEQLKGMDVGFLQSISKLISSCSVLDWNAYERYNKSEPVQTTSNTACCKVLPESTFTTTLFRFLQLLCEGHNEVFQNYLRTQAGNTTTVNIIICTVDYLLRLQESISDFYWHYSDYETIDLQGRENFLKAFKVAKQVFRTLTEYIQGPCVKNQEALAHSRLWDAVSGFLQVFAVLQRKLYHDTSQMELLRELLGLQEEMFILLLSMLEGSVMSSNIGKLMVDMLMESAQYIEDIIQFFSMFVKLNDVTTSKAFKNLSPKDIAGCDIMKLKLSRRIYVSLEYDQNKDGLISYREFEMAMEAQQRYCKEEIAYLMECADTNKDGLLDYKEFTERFHQPAESIGFHLCVLIVHLLDHLPQDRRLECFKYSPQGLELMGHFERNMGCIEILGKSRGIERVYFEVKASQLRQWEDVTIQESKRVFLHSVEMGSQKKKLQGFISFCEDTIFEMDYMDTISGAEHIERESRAVHHRRQHTRVLQLSPQPFLSRIRARVQAFQDEHSPGKRVLAWLSAVMTLTVMRALPVCKSITQAARERVLGGFTALKQRLHPKVTRKSIAEKRKSKLHLDIPPPAVEVRLAATTQEEKSNFFRPRASSSTLDAMKGRDERSTFSRPRAASNIPETNSATDTDERKGSLVHIPRQFRMRQLTLSYNRSTMKPPSQCLETPSPSPQPSQQDTATTEGGSYMPKIAISTRNWQSFLARNYYRLNNLKFAITFIINILLLTVQVERFSETVQPPAENASEKLGLQDMFWSPLLLEGLSTTHFLLSIILIVAYWHLKVPVIIFKREKQVARHLEMQHMWVRKPPETFADWWDHWVISSRSFPQKYWDKQVKERVCNQFSCNGRVRVERLLGMEVHSKYEKRTKWDHLLETMHSLVDLRYWVWVLGVVLLNMRVVYHILYCGLSFIGLRWNYFYFSVHLLDLVINFKLLRHVLGSVLHNGKQLIMTLLMTCVVIYIYTVIAFNFFRKFYREPGQQVYNCESMARCFIYHIDQGLRSGGGIADKLEPASGDPYEFLRLFFDITFFFFVIVILLAIMQGLIIDAFGELRDKEELLTAVMQTKCFICGLDKTSFEHIPHGFDNHIHREHNMAHYMFMLLYLIKKKESEFSGQESYVWDMYLKQNWDFFPVGDCFHAQEDRREQQRKATQAPSPARAAKPVTQL